MRLPALCTALVALAGCFTISSASLLHAQFAPAPVQQPRPVQQQQQPPQQLPPRSIYTQTPAPQQPRPAEQQPPSSAYAGPPVSQAQPYYNDPNAQKLYVPPANQNAGPNVRVAQQLPNQNQPGLPPGQYQPVQGPPPLNYAPAGAPQVPGGPVQVRQQVPVRAMFQLSAAETEQLHRALELWEKEGEQIKNFACQFERWEYDPVFGPGGNIPKTKGYGDLKYVKPDKGRFRIEKLEHYTPGATPNDEPTYQAKKDEFGEQWVCDGTTVFEYKFDQKKLVCYEIPKEMQGKAIVDGPLPFLFGAKKNQLLARYDMKVTNETPDQIWLDAWPLRREDAANYQHVEVILNRKRMLPSAMQVYMPNGKSRMVYIFKPATVNNALGGIIDWFEQPRTPFGWEKIIERAPTPPPAENRQALQPGQTLPR